LGWTVLGQSVVIVIVCCRTPSSAVLSGYICPCISIMRSIIRFAQNWMLVGLALQHCTSMQNPGLAHKPVFDIVHNSAHSGEKTQHVRISRFPGPVSISYIFPYLFSSYTFRFCAMILSSPPSHLLSSSLSLSPATDAPPSGSAASLA